jgi:hypothetical protein
VKLLADGPEPFEEVRVLDLQPWDPDALQVQNRSRVRSHVGSVTDRSAVDKVCVKSAKAKHCQGPS